MTEETQALVDRRKALGAIRADAQFLFADLLAALTTLSRDLAAARACPDCQQPLACPAGTAERIAGLEAMHEETLTRAERAEADLAAARQERNEALQREEVLHHAAQERSQRLLRSPKGDPMTEETQALERYKWGVNIDAGTAYEKMQRAKSGEWVRYEDVAAALTALARDLETARQERDAAQSNYDGACRTIALMHEAATGRSGEGPHLGVVEDVAAAVRAARAETWAAAAAWHEGMAESSVIPSLRPLHQQYAANFRERARLAAREGQ